MRQVLFLIASLFAFLNAYSQVQETWAYSHITELRDQVVDANGNIYQASRAYSEAFDVYATLVIKHDKDGAEIWRRFLPALKVATALTVDAAGNVYVTGIYTTIYFPSGILRIGEDLQIYTAKLDANGIFQWSNIYLGEDGPLYGIPRGIGVDPNGFPYVTGVLYTSLEGAEDSATSDLSTIKYDAMTGNRIWVKRYNGSSPGTGFDDGRGIAIDAFGFVYVSGTSQLNGFLDIVTIKYDGAGNEMWIKRYSNGDPELKNDYANGLKLDMAGNVIVSGASKAGANTQGIDGGGTRVIIKYTFSGFELWVRERHILFFSGGPMIIDNVNNIIESSDGYTKKYNAAGDLIWTYSQDFNDMAVDVDNNIYSVRTCLRSDNNLCGNYYGFTTRKLNSNGVLLWEKTYSLFANGGVWINVDANKNVYTSGSEWLSSPVGGTSYYTVRYSQCEITCPSNITVNVDAGTCSAVVTYPAATTSGYCGSEIAYSHASGSIFPVGVTTVTVSSVETGAECSFAITVVDNENPIINYCPSGKTVNMDAGLCYATASSVDAGIATASDNCSATVVGTRSDNQPLNANYPGGVTIITWKATDPSGNSSTCTQTVTVADNEPPVITGESASTYVLSPPNHTMRDVTINYTATDNCAVTTTLSVTSNEPINGVGDGDTDPDWIVVDNHHVKLRAERSAKGNGRIYTITITATDPSGNTSTKTIEVKVPHNIKKPYSGQAFKVGSIVNFEGEFWDKPGNKHTAKWLIDETTTAKATVTEPSGNKNGTVTGSYKFNTPGVYKLRMYVTDQNGVTHYASTAGDLDAIVVIYDPNGGHTYGGGYFNSPAGALLSNPSSTGKASYGFTMNYFKNSTNPKGETQFEFKVGAFEFNALNFEYLVISNSMAQFKGTGKIIGGQSGVGFTMTVVDGQLDGTGIDKIRMKIYNKNNGKVIYDNQPGANDAALPTQAVGANSVIVIKNNNNSNTPKLSTTQNSEMEATSSEIANDLAVIAYPIPTTNNFLISVKGNSKEKIVMQVVDMYGRVIETRNVSANTIERFGDRYLPGVYFLRVIQGRSYRDVKLIKVTD